MKNLMIYVNPNKHFDDERGVLAKIQIENCLRLGWKPKDIIVVTNFDWTYKGIKSMIVDDSNYCIVHDKASKISVILNLSNNGTFKKGQLHWFHDFDAFQIRKFGEYEPDMGGYNLGLTDYGFSPNWNTGSMFFRAEAHRVFKWMMNEVYNHKFNEERALQLLTHRNYGHINASYLRLNITYNFPSCRSGVGRIPGNYEKAIKPIRVLHFHPFYKGVNYLEKMSGDNPLKKNFIPKGLRDIFKKHLPGLSQNI